MNTAAIEQKTRSRNHWEQQLQPLLLPVDPAVRSAALHKLQSRAGNADNVARILAEDPVLVLRVVHSANKLLKAAGNELKSLPHAISLLGVPILESLLRDAPAYDQQANPWLGELRQQLTISLHAVSQLQGWATLNPLWAGDELLLAALLQRAPVWALWHQEPELMMTLREAQLDSRGARHHDREKQVLGCAIHSLAATLARQWHLPTATQLSWYPSERGNAREWVMLSRIIPEQTALALERFPALQRLVNGPALAVALANRLAEETDWDWYSRRTLRLQHILAVSLRQPLAPTVALTHQLAAASSRHYRMPQTLAPGAQLLGYLRREDGVDRRPLKSVATTPPPQTGAIDDPQPAAPRPAPPGIEALINRLRQHHREFNNLHALFNRVVQSLCLDLDFERASVVLLNSRNRELRTYYSAGCDDSPALKQFRHPLKAGELFSKLLERPLVLRLQASNYTQIWPLLPGTFKQACGVDQFITTSVFVNKKPLALIYADRGHSNGDIDDFQYEWFKRLGNEVSLYLSRRSARKA